VADGIEAGVAERQAGTVGERRPAGAGKLVADRPLAGDAKARQGKVHERHVAAAQRRQIKRRPTGARAHIKKPLARLQAQEFADAQRLVTCGPT
jgi:hypothetical protein